MTESELVAVVIPDFDLAQKELGTKGTPAELVANPALRKRITEELEKTADQYNLKGFERVKEIYFDIAFDMSLLTPTMKVKRHETAQYYKQKGIWKMLYENAKKRGGKAKL